MENLCKKCEFLDIDYEWDDEEVVIYSCQKGFEVGLQENGKGCPYFKGFVAHEYVEKDTKCDKCKNLSKCIERGNCINITTTYDSKNHYILGCGVVCEC